ncbi:nucleotide exchange factor GrpE [Candidatus Woesearchaeota archaeon]|nr:MAG: nucleotide exchange factor GrpE [Candidatus Woesearchaeota archaeon]
MTKKETQERKTEEKNELSEEAKNKEQRENTEKNQEQKASREEELLQDLKRVQADYENYRKRVERDKEEFTKFATKRLVISLIDVLDNFALSLEHKDNHEEFVKGIEMVYAQLLGKLEDEGLKQIPVKEGDPFNPYEHEALMTEHSDKEKDTITKVIQKGYTIHSQIARHAKVIVSKGPEE